MTTKYRSLLVTLREPIREDELLHYQNAIRFFDFVEEVEPCIQELDLAAMTGEMHERKRCIKIAGEALRAIGDRNYRTTLNEDAEP